MESVPEPAVHDFQVPHVTGSRGSSCSLGPPVTLPLPLGGVATLVTGGLLKVVALEPQRWLSVGILLRHWPNDDVPSVIWLLRPRPEGQGHTLYW